MGERAGQTARTSRTTEPLQPAQLYFDEFDFDEFESREGHTCCSFHLGKFKGVGFERQQNGDVWILHCREAA